MSRPQFLWPLLGIWSLVIVGAFLAVGSGRFEDTMALVAVVFPAVTALVAVTAGFAMASER